MHSLTDELNNIFEKFYNCRNVTILLYFKNGSLMVYIKQHGDSIHKDGHGFHCAVCEAVTMASSWQHHWGGGGLCSCLFSLPLPLNKCLLNLYCKPDLVLHAKDMKPKRCRGCSQRDYNLVGNVTEMSKNDSNNVAGVRKIIGKYRLWGRQIFLWGKESVKSREVSSLVFTRFFF